MAGSPCRRVNAIICHKLLVYLAQSGISIAHRQQDGEIGEQSIVSHARGDLFVTLYRIVIRGSPIHRADHELRIPDTPVGCCTLELS